MHARYVHPEHAKLPAAHVKQHSTPASKRSDVSRSRQKTLMAPAHGSQKNTPKAKSQQPSLAYQRSVFPSYGGMPAIAILT